MKLQPLRVFLIGLITVLPYNLLAQDTQNTASWEETVSYIQENINLLSNKQETVKATEHTLVKTEIMENEVYTFTILFKELRLVEITDSICDSCSWGLVVVTDTDKIKLSIDNKNYIHTHNYISLDYYPTTISEDQLAVVKALQHLSFLASR
ncbi:hypothetical protein [Marixanthomonas ophiurae]|uniref:DUF4468 domain-containing protein n=1 Tax=Marixanthomonas ophiurae TaxID=387659 RepID=A0A3E1Q7P5_9FLAO|nr:hypothetical protein [Marixanthomonas ophiurae]RFN58159.1 hypothetical protein DZ858_13070 [Marixanthomonas ophiurae]